MHNQEIELLERELMNAWYSIEYAVRDRDVDRIRICYHVIKDLKKKIEQEINTEVT